MTGGAYLGSLGLAGVLFYFFNPSGAGDCSFNVTMITFTLILGLAMTGVSMTPSLVSASLPEGDEVGYICTLPATMIVQLTL